VPSGHPLLPGVPCLESRVLSQLGRAWPHVPDSRTSGRTPVAARVIGRLMCDAVLPVDVRHPSLPEPRQAVGV